MDQFLIGFFILLVIMLSSYAIQNIVLLKLCPKRNSENNLASRKELSYSVDNPSNPCYSEKGAGLPKVTIQIPVYNERYMVSRIINAVANIDYPSNLLQIQVLDDSTDDTPEIARQEVEKFRGMGLNIELMHRDHRVGYKSGALAEGLKSAEGEFIAVFDADFVPHPNFLQRLIVDLKGFDDPKTGFVQTRWVYLNREHNMLTKALGLIMDVHFFIDQPARCHADLPFTFNGSGGIWRKTCIEDAGGWHFDTLTEDLDLSYRAKMKSWNGLYFIEEESPNDLPSDILAIKQQQKRWARGNAQCFRKLFFSVLGSNFSPWQKISSLYHMSGYFLNVLVLFFIFVWPFFAFNVDLIQKIPVLIHLLGPLCFVFAAAMFVSNNKRGGDVKYFFRVIPFSILLGIGVSVSNTASVALGLFSKQTGVFERTPKGFSAQGFNEPDSAPDSLNKLDVQGKNSASGRKQLDHGKMKYRLTPDWTMWVEMGVACYALIMLVLILKSDGWPLAFPMLLYGVAFGGMSLMQVRDMIRFGSRADQSILEAVKLVDANRKSLSESDAASPAE